MLIVIMLIVTYFVLLSVAMLNVVIQSVVAPLSRSFLLSEKVYFVATLWRIQSWLPVGNVINLFSLIVTHYRA
jgi:hypothetical protein